MSTKFKCPHCGQSLDAPDAMRGEETECPACSRPVTVSTINVTTEAKEESDVKTNIPQAICNICAAIMFLCISFLALFGAVQAKRSADVIDSGLNAMSIQAERSTDVVTSCFDELTASQKDLQEQATIGSEILSEVLAYVAAKSLEEAEVLSPTEASSIAGDALRSIDKRSER
ncbi:MAG: hypothetical protein JW741_25370 [Sedimentisphaerales bacterium]|nr:hypothetical protein [Sedimentisphaerales bacterium]